MNLLVDIGNTRIKWCLLKLGALTGLAALRYTGDQLPALRTAWSTLPRPHAVRVATVVGGGIAERVTALALELWGLHVLFERPRQGVLGLRLAYGEPERLGVDRWLAMLAARHRGAGPALVVDCGSAVTLDALDSSGNHLGGLIVPGLDLMWSTLCAGTGIGCGGTGARVPEWPRADESEPMLHPSAADHWLLGTDTATCMGAGAVQAIIGLIERIRMQLSVQGPEPRLVLTGGDAPRIVGQLAWTCELVPELVLEGLALLPD